MKLSQLIRVVGVVICGFLSVSCSTAHFDSQWRTAAHTPAADAFSGRWDGTWHSTRGTHHGALQCIFTPVDKSHYRADFKAHWKVFTAPYSVVFHAARRGPALRFEGKHDLGPLAGGVYTYSGTVTPGRFQACYDSSYDTGIFELKRP
jgi:hypothetical protein